MDDGARALLPHAFAALDTFEESRRLCWRRSDLLDTAPRGDAPLLACLAPGVRAAKRPPLAATRAE